MIAVRPSHERGSFDFGWLKTAHTFSFGEYHDPDHMGFRALRVINEDHVAPGQGFGMHRHRDMEIVTFVVAGALEHKDNLGNSGVIQPGRIQRMTAGTGVMHSEFNASATDPVHLLQIWIMPERPGLTPGYEEKSITDGASEPTRLLASRDGRDASVTIHQDAEIHQLALPPGVVVRHDFAPGRHAWVQVVSGRLSVNDHMLSAGDGAAISDEAALDLRALDATSALLFDLA